MVASFESVSTWRAPLPARASASRRQVVADLAVDIAAASPGRLRVAVDGRTGAGKTIFGHELAAALQSRGRSTARASLDDFKYPWRHARAYGYDRVSGEGYYRNAYDHGSVVDLLLEPAGATGSGTVVLCAHDPLTGQDHRDVTVELPGEAVLIVDSVFALRPEYAHLWDYRIWLEVDPQVALARGIDRDREREGATEAVRLHRDRYRIAEEFYLSEADPPTQADAVVDNTDLDRPHVLRLRSITAAGERSDPMTTAGKPGGRPAARDLGGQGLDNQALHEVVALERLLLNSDVRSSAAQTQALLHRDYLEYGASGRVWDRTAMIAALAADPAVSGEGVDFAPVRLAPDVILLTYRIVGEAGSIRSSVWVRESSRWQVRFHQGTRSRPPA